jgi:hypothetical protein
MFHVKRPRIDRAATMTWIGFTGAVGWRPDNVHREATALMGLGSCLGPCSKDERAHMFHVKPPRIDQ